MHIIPSKVFSRFASAIGALTFLCSALPASADSFTDAVQQQLNFLFPTKTYTVQKAPATGASSPLVVAIDAAILSDTNAIANATNYVNSVLNLRTDKLKIAGTVVGSAVTVISGSATAGDIGTLAFNAANLAGMTDTVRASIASSAILAAPSAVDNVTNNVNPLVSTADKLTFAKNVVKSLGTNNSVITSFIKDVDNGGNLPTDVNTFTVNVALGFPSKHDIVGAVIKGGAQSSANSGNDANEQALANLAITKIAASAASISAAIAPLTSNPANFAVAVANGRTDTLKAQIAAGAVEGSPGSAASIVTNMFSTYSTLANAKSTFTLNGVKALGIDVAGMQTFTAAVVGTGVTPDLTTFTTTVIGGLSSDHTAAGAVAAGAASTLSDDTSKTNLAIAAINKLAAAATEIAADVGALISNSTTPANFANNLINGLTKQTSTNEELITKGVVQANPSSAAAIVNAVLTQHSATFSTTALKAAFASTVASGVASNNSAVAAIAASVATGLSDTDKGTIAAAVAGVAPGAAGDIAASIITNDGVDPSVRATFAATIAKNSKVKKVPSAVGDLAYQIANTQPVASGTSSFQIQVAISVINATKLATQVSESVAQLYLAADPTEPSVISGSTQAAFAENLALKLPTYASSIAAGVAASDPADAGDIAAYTVAASPTTVKLAAKIAGAVTAAVPANASDVAVEIGQIMNGTIPNHTQLSATERTTLLKATPSIASAIASVVVKTSNLGNINANLAAIASDFIALIPAPLTNIKIILSTISNIVKLYPNAGPSIAGSTAQAIYAFSGLSGPTLNSILDQIGTTIKKITSSTVDVQVDSNINLVKNGNGNFQIGAPSPHESPFDPN